MKKLFLCILAFTTGALAFVSCDKDKNLDDAKEQKLSYEQQQVLLSASLNTAVQSIDFSSLGQTIKGIMAEFGDNTIDFETMLGAIAEQNEIVGGKINAIRELLFVQEDIRFDFDDLYFEADLDFKLDTIPVPDGAGGFRDTIIIMPVLSNVMPEAEQFKLNVGFNNKEEKAVIVLKGHSDVESRVSFKDTTTHRVKNITLPDTLDLSVTIGSKPVLWAKIGYSTDFQVQVEGTGSIIRKEIDGVKPDKFKLTKLVLNGEELSLDAAVKLGNYSIMASADYDKENGLNIDAKAQMMGSDILFIRAKVDATLNKNMDWKNFMGSIYPWLSASYDRKVRGAQVEAVMGNDDIKLLASVDLTNNETLNALLPFIISKPKNDSERNALSQKTVILNNRIKGELYFKGYNNPQAKINIIYDAKSAGEIQTIDAHNINKDVLLSNLKNSGLRVMIDTYDSEGNEVTLSFQEYFGAIDIKSMGKVLLSKLTSTFGPLFTKEFEELPGEGYFINEDIGHGGGRTDDVVKEG